MRWKNMKQMRHIRQLSTWNGTTGRVPDEHKKGSSWLRSETFSYHTSRDVARLCSLQERNSVKTGKSLNRNNKQAATLCITLLRETLLISFSRGKCSLFWMRNTVQMYKTHFLATCRLELGQGLRQPKYSMSNQTKIKISCACPTGNWT